MVLENRKKRKVKIFKDNCRFKIDSKRFKTLAENLIFSEKILICELRIVFVNSKYLQNLHRRYLHDSSKTDVMTFNFGDPENIEGEIYISLEQAQLNAQYYAVPFHEEIARLIIHGILHLLGCEDKTEKDKIKMKKLENTYLEKHWHKCIENHPDTD